LQPIVLTVIEAAAPQTSNQIFPRVAPLSLGIASNRLHRPIHIHSNPARNCESV